MITTQKCRYTRTKAMTHKSMLIGAVIAAATVVFCWIAFRPASDASAYRKEPFARSLWVSPVDANHRLRMVDDLLATHSFAGFTSNQVVELLGPPAPPPPRNHALPAAMKEFRMLYGLGDDRTSMLSALGTTWLGFHLDSSNRVMRTKIIVHRL